MSKRFHPMRPGTYTVSSGYGPRWGGHHNGVDFAAKVGTPIYAPADGVVVQGKDRARGSVQGFGSWIWLDCQASVGRDFIFGHVNHPDIAVKKGDRVKAGQRIGTVGNEGVSTGPHLHFEVWGPPGRIGGKHEDPERYLAGAAAPGDTARPRTVLDFSAAVPSAASVKAAGHSGAVRYISDARSSWMKAKPARRADVAAYRDAGLGVAFVYQYGAGSAATSDVMRGADGGTHDAKAAQRNLTAAGCPDHPVYFAVDFDIADHQWNDHAREYFRAAAAVLGRDRVGIYGGARAIDLAIRDRAIADLGGGKYLAWQTKSWSAGRIHPAAVLYQRVHNTPGPDGVAVDVNDVLHAEWGQNPTRRGDTRPAPDNDTVTNPEGSSVTIKPNPKHRGDPTFLPDLLRAWGVEVVEFEGWRDRGQGDFDDIQGVMVHHTGAASTSPETIAFGHAALRGLLSQIHLSPTGVATICGAGIAYHAGPADPGRGGPAGQGLVTRPSVKGPTKYNSGNARYIGIEAQHSGNPKDPWPDAQMEAYARICAAICWYLGFGTDRVIAHKEYAPSRKVDPTFVMEGFRRRVHELLQNPPAAVTGATTPKPGTPAPNPKENNVLPEKIRSIINPKVELPLATLLALLDAYAWEQRAAMRHLYDELGLDYDTVVTEAIAADREATK